MIQNYLKIAFRNLLRNKVYSFINIAGLALGISAFLLILEYISFEKSVNQFHANLPNIYRLLNENAKGETWAQIEPGWAKKAKERFPEIKEFCRVADGVASGIAKNEAKNISFREEKVAYAEGNFFSFFSFPLKAGHVKGFNKPDVIFISQAAAKKYFGSENPMGKVLTFFNQFGKKAYSVGGIYANMSDNSDIQFDMVLSLETLKNPANLGDNSWANLDNLDSQYIDTYFGLNQNVDYHSLEKKFITLRNDLSKENDAIVFRLQRLSDIRLAPSFSDNYQHSGNVKYIYMLGGIAFLILLIGWFNYIILSTANSLKRANEVGVRKVIGATQGNLIGHFLGESLLINALSFGLAVFLIVLLQPLFNQLIQKNLTIQTLASSWMWAIGLGFLLLGSLASGAYTAFTLANFKTIETLKGKVSKSTKGILLRKSLVVSQFSISMVLIIATGLIYSQLKYMQTQNLGMNINQLVIIRGPQIGKDNTYKGRKTAFLNEVVQQSSVKDYCLSGSVPGNFYNFSTAGFTSSKSQKGDELKAYSTCLLGVDIYRRITLNYWLDEILLLLNVKKNGITIARF